MSWYFSLYLIALVFSAAVMFGLAILLSRQGRDPARSSAFWLLIIMAFYTLAILFDFLAQTQSQKLFWAQVELVISVLIPPAWILFAARYTGLIQHKVPRWFWLFALEPAAIVYMGLTNNRYSVLWTQLPYSPNVLTPLSRAQFIPIYWFHIGYFYLTLLAGAILILQAGRTDRKRIRLMTFWVILGVGLPLVSSLVFLDSPYALGGANLAPILFAVCSLLLALWTHPHWSSNLLPLVRGMVIDAMQSGVLVLNVHNRVVEMNRFAAELLEVDASTVLGLSGEYVLSDWPELHEEIKQIDDRERRLEVARGQGAKQRFYSVQVSPVKEKNGSLVGSLVMWHDISQQKNAEATLRRQLQELGVLNAVALACVEADSEDELIGRVTEIIGATLYTENFGVLTVDDDAGLLRFHPSYHGLPDGFQEVSLRLDEGVIGRVASTGAAMRVQDVRDEPVFRQVFPPRVRSELCVPIKISDRVIGVINVQHQVPGAFSASDERLLVTVASQLATGMERMRVNSAERYRVAELSAIIEISREISASLDPRQVLDAVSRHAAELLRADLSAVVLKQPDGYFSMVVAQGLSNGSIERINSLRFELNQALEEKSFNMSGPLQFQDLPELLNQLPDSPWSELVTAEALNTAVLMPLMRGEEPIGWIGLGQRSRRRFSQDDLRFLQALAHQSLNAIENARLFDAEREQRRLAEILRETGTRLTATLDLEGVLDRLLVDVAEVVPYDGASVFLIEGDQARVARTRGYEHIDARGADELSNLVFSISGTPNLFDLVESQRPAFLRDTHAQPDWQPVSITPYLHAWCGAPVIENGRAVALFSVDKREPGFFRQEHADRLAVFAGQAGLALQNARLFDEKRRRLNEVTLLSEIITVTASALDFTEALKRVCRIVAHFFDASQSAFALIESSGKQAEVIAEYQGPGRDSALGIKIPVCDNPSMSYVLEHKRPLAIVNTQKDPLMAKVRELMKRREAVSILLVPILLQGEVAGTLGIDHLDEHIYSAADLALMEKIASQVGQALERVRLFTAARQQAERMADLARVSGELNRPLTVDELIQQIVEAGRRLGETDRLALFVRMPGEIVICPFYTGISTDYIQAVLNEYNGLPGGRMNEQTEPILIGNMANLAPDSLIRSLAQIADYQALALWPMVYQGKVMATLACYYDEPRQWSDDLREVMLAFARQAMAAWENARLFDETRRRASQQEAINAIIIQAVTAPNLETMLDEILALALQALQLESGGIWVAGKQVVHGLPGDIGRLSAQLGSESRVQTVVVSDWQQVDASDPINVFRDHMADFGLRASLTVPILSEGGAIGGLSVACETPHTWMPEDVALMEAVGRQLGSAVERLNLLARVQEQARQVQQIMDTVPEGVLVLDNDFRIIVANPAARDHLQHLAANVQPGQALLALGGRAVSELLESTAESVWQELESRNGDKTQRYFEVAVRPLEEVHTESELVRSSGWVLVLRDVTQERQSQRQIQMQERLATVGQLAAGIAHDFNNIMAAIVVYTELLALDPALSPASQERLKIIHHQVQRASSLIRQILDFSRRSVIEPSRLDLLPFIKELDKLLARVLPETIRIELAYQPGTYPVNADPTRLQQAFMNLALNARDAMPKGGVLHFKLEILKLKVDEPLPLADLAPGEWVKLSVSDTGYGIAAEHLPHIFDPFFTTKPVGQGTGLGLAQVYGIIKQHGGSISVESQEGVGTTFSIFLPRLLQSSEDEGRFEQTIALSGHGQTVMVVEDNQAARRALEDMLEAMDYRVLSAENGVEALQILELLNEPVELVVSDMVMPRMGGVELYRALSKRQARLKMLFVTGHPLSAGDRTLLEEGQVHWLQKPFTISDFSQAVMDLLGEL